MFFQVEIMFCIYSVFQVQAWFIVSLTVFQESRANRLAEELGAAKVREAQLEVQMQSEINRLSAEICSLRDACQREVSTRTEIAPAILIILSLLFLVSE